MGLEKEGSPAAQKKAVAEMLRKAEQIYIIFSKCTKMPYVICDADTYDDEIFLYLSEDAAKEAAKKLLEDQEPVQAMKIEKKDFVAFYVSLIPMGVNCVLVNQDHSGERQTATEAEPCVLEGIPIQLDEIIRRNEPEEGKVLIENPQLHLTALYFMQKVRKLPQIDFTEELKSLHEEMMVHYQRGRYIIPVKENAGTLMMKQKNGQIFQPVFTDIQEYRKFISMHHEENVKTAVLSAERIAEILAPEAAGVVVNPLGVNLQLQIKRGKQG